MCQLIKFECFLKQIFISQIIISNFNNILVHTYIVFLKHYFAGVCVLLLILWLTNVRILDKKRSIIILLDSRIS